MLSTGLHLTSESTPGLCLGGKVFLNRRRTLAKGFSRRLAYAVTTSCLARRRMVAL
jgi:hypothetical protein